MTVLLQNFPFLLRIYDANFIIAGCDRVNFQGRLRQGKGARGSVMVECFHSDASGPNSTNQRKGTPDGPAITIAYPMEYPPLIFKVIRDLRANKLKKGEAIERTLFMVATSLRFEFETTFCTHQ
jgi:hypothetical protein